MIADWNDDPTANQVTSKCQQYFATLGVPITFRSDNGPQYNSANFKKFLQRWGVVHNPSTPYYLQANYAKVAVKKAKSMIGKLTNPKLNMEEFAEAILELRNTPGVDGRSLSEIVFGTNLHTAFDECWKKAADEADLKHSQIHEKAYYNYSAKDLKPLSRNASENSKSNYSKVGLYWRNNRKREKPRLSDQNRVRKNVLEKPPFHQEIQRSIGR